MIATAGDTARVDTQVAIALAVSWKPFTKSKIRAKAITIKIKWKLAQAYFITTPFNVSEICLV